MMALSIDRLFFEVDFVGLKNCFEILFAVWSQPLSLPSFRGWNGYGRFKSFTQGEVGERPNPLVC